MTNQEAYKRAYRAVLKIWDETEHFDHGGLASHEIIRCIRDALAKEFKH